MLFFPLSITQLQEFTKAVLTGSWNNKPNSSVSFEDSEFANMENKLLKTLCEMHNSANNMNRGSRVFFLMLGFGGKTKNQQNPKQNRD